jgi:uncharacterized membrane protein HdeD (DUF308 family)
VAQTNGLRADSSADMGSPARLRRHAPVRSSATFLVVALGPVLAVATYLVLGPLDQGVDSNTLRLVLLADMVYVLVVAALVLAGIFRMVVARRSKSEGSRLHMRLTGVFALLALIPTVLVAVFAGAHHQCRSRRLVFRPGEPGGRQLAGRRRGL